MAGAGCGWRESQRKTFLEVVRECETVATSRTRGKFRRQTLGRAKRGRKHPGDRPKEKLLSRYELEVLRSHRNRCPRCRSDRLSGPLHR
jgi:hypothetical protein